MASPKGMVTTTIPPIEQLLAAVEHLLADATPLPRSTCHVVGIEALAELESALTRWARECDNAKGKRIA